MTQKLNRILVSILLSLIPTLILWAPFFFRVESVWGIPLPREGMATLVSNYDGPLYIVAAKSMYDQSLIKAFEFGLPTEYYAAHFPLFPFLIKTFASLFGFPYAMLFVTLASSALTLYYFNKLISEYVSSENAWWLTAVFAILPARWLIVRSVGSPEPLFIAAIIASVYYFKHNKFFLAGLWGGIAAVTKSPGIILFISYVLTISVPLFKEIATTNMKLDKLLKKTVHFIPLLLIPVSLMLVFLIYKVKMNDFWAYFHSGDNIHLFLTPFQIFNYSQSWVGTFWLEEIIFIYLIGGVGLFKLIEMKEEVMAWFVGVFFTLILFVSHRDVLRYALPIVPFLFIAYKESLIKREFRLVMAIIVIPILLFSLAYISQNRMPIADWAPLL